MSTGRISKTTLGLRFMQNARSQQDVPNGGESGTVKDDGEWQVSQEVRDAWGLRASSKAIEDFPHETSYVPFIYSSEGSEQPKGRRVFGQSGKEPEKEAPVAESTTDVVEKDGVRVPRGKIKSISSATQKHFAPSKDKSKAVKSARAAIYDSSGVGIDLSKAKNASPSDNPVASESKGFLKPADVPDPRPNPRDRASSDSALMDGNSEIVSGARMKSKRAHPGSEDADGVKKKRKKKKTLEQSLE